MAGMNDSPAPKTFACAGKLIVTKPIRVVELPSTVTGLPFLFYQFALVEFYLH